MARLFTREDPKRMHATTGALALLSFFYRLVLFARHGTSFPTWEPLPLVTDRAEKQSLALVGPRAESSRDGISDLSLEGPRGSLEGPSERPGSRLDAPATSKRAKRVRGDAAAGGARRPAAFATRREWSGRSPRPGDRAAAAPRPPAQAFATVAIHGMLHVTSFIPHVAPVRRFRLELERTWPPGPDSRRHRRVPPNACRRSH